MSCASCKFYNKLIGDCVWGDYHNLPYYLRSQENYVYSDDGDFCETYVAKSEVKNNV